MLLRDMGECRRHGGILLSSLGSKQMMMRRLCSIEQCPAQIDPAIRVFLCSVRDHIQWTLRTVEAVLDGVRGAYSNYTQVQSTRMALTNEQANRVVKTLTVLLATTTPLNLAASLLGMSAFLLSEVYVHVSFLY